MAIVQTLFWFIFGAAIGSFLNVVICRLQTGESFVSGRSHCGRCGGRLAWYDLLPLVSFICLFGRCRYCQSKIAWRYLLIEIATGLLFGLGAMTVAGKIQLLIYLAAVSFFVVLFVYDLEAYIVPDSVSLPALAVVLVLNLAAGANWLSILLGMIAGALWFLIQFWLSRGRWVGGGDIRLGALIGALLGWPYVALALMLSYVGGSVIALGLLLARRARLGSRLPFATMLLPASLITWLYGSQIWRAYLNVLSL